MTFDRDEWKENDQWTVPICEHEYNSMMGNGTAVTLEKMIKNLSIPEIERFVRERLPMDAPHFEVYISGRRFPIYISTGFGNIQGEIIAPNFRQKIPLKNVGIETTVKGVVIKKDTFEMELE